VGIDIKKEGGVNTFGLRSRWNRVAGWEKIKTEGVRGKASEINQNQTEPFALRVQII
jgi:hypothetical protein